MGMPLPELKYLLRQSYCKETTFTPDKWTPENPTYGHCAAMALLVQDVLGGEIHRGVLPKEWAEKLGYCSHYWNYTGGPRDFSRDQFPLEFPYDDFIAGKLGENPNREDKRKYLLSNPETKKRYELLKERFNAVLNSNPLFLDEKFQLCWYLAFYGRSVCPKMRFTCLVYDDKKLISQTVNSLMSEKLGKPRFCSLDGKECIRLGIQSRMDAAVGDCGHAPMWALSNVWNLGYKRSDLGRLNFYEAGFRIDGSPWWRTEFSYTCIDCQNRFVIFGLDKIWIAHEGKWQPAWTRDSFYSSGEYMQGKKKA